MTLGSLGSNAKAEARLRRLNILQDCPPSRLMYAPVMSQSSSTVLGSCGLIVGRNIPPAPPGPIIFQASKRGAGPRLAAHNNSARKNGENRRIIRSARSVLESRQRRLDIEPQL